jgi:hypothetical protein
MKRAFIEKYRDYCKSMDTKDEIFWMIQGDNKSLEDCEEIFYLNYKKAHSCM